MLQVSGAALRVVCFVNEIELKFEAPAEIADDPAEVVVFVHERDDVLKEQNRADVAVKSLLKIDVLNLHRDVLAVLCLCSEDLREGSSCDRLVVELSEEIVRRFTEILQEQSINLALLPFKAFVLE